MNRRIFLTLALGSTASVAMGCRFGMTPKNAHEDSDKDFLEYLSENGKDIEAIKVSELFESCLSFYRDRRYHGLDPDPSSDMLLYEWGVYEWGNGEYFQIGIKRQFIAAGTVDDEGYTQLYCDAFFSPTSELAALGSGNKWCGSRDDLNDFEQFVKRSEAYRVVAELKPLKVVVRTDGV